MKKIRINELARELEVKAHEIIDKLPELGVTEKKTHSSSIDDDVADALRVAFGHEAVGAVDVPEPGSVDVEAVEVEKAPVPEPAEVSAGHPAVVAAPEAETAP